MNYTLFPYNARIQWYESIADYLNEGTEGNGDGLPLPSANLLLQSIQWHSLQRTHKIVSMAKFALTGDININYWKKHPILYDGVYVLLWT